MSLLTKQVETSFFTRNFRIAYILLIRSNFHHEVPISVRGGADVNSS